MLKFKCNNRNKKKKKQKTKIVTRMKRSNKIYNILKVIIRASTSRLTNAMYKLKINN